MPWRNRELQSVPVLTPKALRKLAMAIVVPGFTHAFAEDEPRTWQTYAHQLKVRIGFLAEVAFECEVRLAC